MQDLAVGSSREQKGKNLTKLEPNVHTIELTRVTIPSIATCRLEKYDGWMVYCSADVIKFGYTNGKKPSPFERSSGTLRNSMRPNTCLLRQWIGGGSSSKKTKQLPLPGKV